MITTYHIWSDKKTIHDFFSENDFNSFIYVSDNCSKILIYKNNFVIINIRKIYGYRFKCKLKKAIVT